MTRPAGLDPGRPAGFLDRQIGRWGQQRDASGGAATGSRARELPRGPGC